MTGRIWLDVEDLFEYARVQPRPSGIQRLAFEIYRAMWALPRSVDAVRFVRHDSARNSFRVVSWQEIETLFENLANSDPQPVTTSQPILPHGPSRQIARKLVYRLGPSLRVHVIDVLLTQRIALAAWGKLFRAIAHSVFMRVRNPVAPRSLGRTIISPGASDETIQTDDAVDFSEDFAASSKQGDTILVLGSPWSHPDYAMLIQAHRRRGFKFGLLIYDLIPLRRPEWCDRGLVRVFRAWFDGVIPLCDALFAISRATATDVENYARERGIALAGPVTPLPIGTSFAPRQSRPRGEDARALPPAGSFALIVSTIEARKNHMLLFRIWRRMLDEMPAETVPTLVFAGRIGWLVDDLMRQIANTNNLDGKLIVIENPTDAELTALYSGCLLTLFPSFFEGWGLPVTESLSFGKPCISSDRTSLPEAGGNLTRRFDPDDLNQAYELVRSAIMDRAGLAAWEMQIRREFKPTPWSATAEAILSGLAVKTADVIDLERIRQDDFRQRDVAQLQLEARAR